MYIKSYLNSNIILIMKKAIVYTTLGLVIVIGGVYGASNIYAQEFGFRGNVPEEVRQEHMAERTAARAEAIVQATEEGNITERQLEILNAMEDLRPEGGRGMFGAARDLTPEEREILRESMREEREQSMLDALNEAGLDVTHEELEELRELRMELGLMGKQNRRGGNGEGCNY
jgi:hypothetical protein